MTVNRTLMHHTLIWAKKGVSEGVPEGYIGVSEGTGTPHLLDPRPLDRGLERAYIGARHGQYKGSIRRTCLIQWL